MACPPGILRITSPGQQLESKVLRRIDCSLNLPDQEATPCDKGDHRIALKVLSRALQVSGFTDEELIGIFYLTGRAFESLGEDGAALEWYERVLSCDMHFRDASQRVSSLRA